MDDGSIITQLGIGGIFCILVLREVFTFVNNRRSNGDNGKGDSVGRTELYRVINGLQTVNNCGEIVKRIDSMLSAFCNQRREDRADHDKRMDAIDKALGDLWQSLKENREQEQKRHDDIAKLLQEIHKELGSSKITG